MSAASSSSSGARPGAATELRTAMALGLVVAWTLLMRRFGESSIYDVMGPFALAVLVVVGMTVPRAWWRRRWRPEATPILVGLAVGIVTTGLTYPVFGLAAQWFPSLPALVSDLYSVAHEATLAQRLAWVVCIIVAEEVLFRGVLLDALDKRLPFAVTSPAVVVLYAVAQLGSGSWVVALMAVVMGSVWTLQRRLTDSLLSPLIAHLVWTPTVILLVPVVG